MPKVIIPYSPREAFKPLHNRTARWAVIVAHRRAGKTVACVNELIKSALLAKKPNSRFGYVAPFYKQAKNIAWGYVKQYSKNIVGTTVNEAELRVDFPNGSRISLYGADNPDSLRGLYFDGIVADEYGDWKPSVWNYVIRPALADRQGWAIIIGTPKGHNQFWETYERLKNDPNGFTKVLRVDESGILPQSEIDDMRKEMSEDAWRQEMECDFDAAIPGAIYGSDIYKMQESGRIKSNLYDPALKTHAVLDLGFSDDTAILWFQVGKELRIVDAYSNHGMPIAHYHDVLKAKKYKYGEYLWLPHDARARSLQTGRSIEEQFDALGWMPRIVPELALMDGIQAGRLSLFDGYIDAGLTEFLEALKQYQRQYDEDNKCFKDKPKHDWTSHYADAFRYAALVWTEEMKVKEPEPVKYVLDLSFNELRDRNAARFN